MATVMKIIALGRGSWNNFIILSIFGVVKAVEEISLEVSLEEQSFWALFPPLGGCSDTELLLEVAKRIGKAVRRRSD